MAAVTVSRPAAYPSDSHRPVTAHSMDAVPSRRPACAPARPSDFTRPRPHRRAPVWRNALMRKEALLLVPALAAVVGTLVVVSRSGAG
jgi:hypothetical protein